MEKTYFYFGAALRGTGDSRLNNETIRSLWKGFCFQAGSLSLAEGSAFSFRTGAQELPRIPDGKEFALRVTEEGIALAARDYPALVRGMMVLLMRVEPVDLTEGQERFRIESCALESRYTVQTRMLHLCVFPETTPDFLRKCLRLAGVMQYTHLVLEFWGMLKFDCLKELSWENAFSKEFAGQLGKEARDLGMDVVPMLNHLGHASACRVSGGKHVVLDQNPRLAPLFSPDGWSWNLRSPRVPDLLRELRRELYEVFPGAQYFHLGCDEVYSYETGDEAQALMARFLRDRIEEVLREGKRPIIWGDMLLNAQACGVGKPYFCGCDTPEHARQLLEAIPRETVIADWHYDVLQPPVKTSIYLKQQGFQVLGAPWFQRENCRAYVDTVRDSGLMGIMVTTWHTLAQQMPHVVTDALLCGAYQSPWSGPEISRVRTETAALLRKVSGPAATYAQAGWTDSQIFTQANPMT